MWVFVFVSRFGNIRICVFKFRRVFIFGVSALGHDMQGLPAPTSNAEQVGRGAGTPFPHLLLPHQTGDPLPSVHSGSPWGTEEVVMHSRHPAAFPPPQKRPSTRKGSEP